MVAPVPGKAQFYADASAWLGRVYTIFNAAGVGTLAGSTAIQYDGQNCAFRELDRTGDNATWDPIINRFWQEYDYYINTTANPDGQIPAYLSHTDGLAQDVVRATSRSAASLQNIADILANGPYVNSNGGDPVDTTPYMREVAYCLAAFLNYQLAGQSLTPTQLARRNELLEYSIDHINFCAAGGEPYVRPFMVGVVSKVLIQYYTQITADSRILSALAAASEYIWTACFKTTAGAWGAANAFLYTDRTGFDGDDAITQPTLNMLIAPLYGWLWSQTGEQQYRDRGDLIFAGGQPVYSGGLWVSGAYLGSEAAALPKQVFEQYYWGHKYIDYAETEVNPVIMTTIPCTREPSENNNVTPIKVNFAIIDTDYTIATPSDSSKRIVLCGMVYQEADAHTLTFKSASNIIATLQRTTFDGNWNGISKEAFLVTEPGEALTVRSSVLIVDILFYTFECTKLPW